ncbi:hypothetical protein [Methylobacterium sp. V23]|uniref:hypothetical protein n=1 Tax=Methylobacterium sp. V23 TaxID=2044878 RepID=UPI000CDB7059|nr:hypothetical protein [Methylobacterium sp. V23]POR42545.1 hypothetical protein CRT23_12200 [Methylobacterium sp. V23]
MNVIDLQSVRDAREQAAFEAYVSAKAVADETLRILDMAAAVKAWNAFVELTCPTAREQEGLLG